MNPWLAVALAFNLLSAFCNAWMLTKWRSRLADVDLREAALRAVQTDFSRRLLSGQVYVTSLDDDAAGYVCIEPHGPDGLRLTIRADKPGTLKFH